jgi:hypothetical protein
MLFQPSGSLITMSNEGVRNGVMIAAKDQSN